MLLLHATDGGELGAHEGDRWPIVSQRVIKSFLWGRVFASTASRLDYGHEAQRMSGYPALRRLATRGTGSKAVGGNVHRFALV